MKWGEILRLSRRFSIVGGNRFSRVMMVTGIFTLTLCIAIMLVASYITKGFYNEISSKLFDFWGHIYVSGSFYDETYTTDSMPYDEELVTTILASTDKDGRPLIESCTPVIVNSSILQGKEDLDGILAKGVTTDYLQYFLEKYGTDWDAELITEERSIALSKTIASTLQVQIGQSVLLHFIRDADFVTRKFRVAALYNTGMAELDDRLVLMPLRDMQQVLRWDDNEIGGYELFVHNLDKLEETDEILYNEVLPVNLFSTNIRDKYPATFDWLQMQKINQRLIFYMLLLVCMANLVSIMLLLFMERIHFIGVMKSLGASQRDLRRFFLLVGGRILLIALLLGNLVAWGFSAIQEKFHFIKLNEQDYFISYVPISFDWGYFLQVNVFLIVIGVIALLLPISIIKRFSAIKILGIK